jgi:flagellar assembly protein FliH
MQAEPMIITNNFLAKEVYEVDEVDEVEEVKEVLIDTSMMDELIASARNEASDIVAEAKMLSEQSLHDANQQVEQIKQQAYAEGYEKGAVEGKQIVLDEMQQILHEAVENAQRVVDNAGKEAKEMILAAERQIVDIALAVASKILAREIEENPFVVLPIVKAALEKVRDQEQIVVRVGVEDFDAVLHAKQDLQIMIGREHDLKIMADRTIEAGSCVIDTSYGMVDARMDTQFESLKKALQGVLS